MVHGTQLLDLAADKYCDNCLTSSYRAYFSKHLQFRPEKLQRKVVENFFQAITRKVKRHGKEAAIFYDDGSFESSGAGAPGGVPIGSMKRACKWRYLTRAASEHRTSRLCMHCKQEDATETEDHAQCMRCEAPTRQKQWAHKDKRGAQNIGRSGISDAKGRRRPLDLRVPPSER